VRGCGEESTPTVLACLGLLRVYASNQPQQLKCFTILPLLVRVAGMSQSGKSSASRDASHSGAHELSDYELHIRSVVMRYSK